MTQKLPKKIVLLVDCLSKGGAEKAAAVLSQILFKNHFEISIVSLKNDITYSYAGNLINIGVNKSKYKWIKQAQKVFQLKRVFKNLNADYIIDFRMRNRFLMEYVLYNLVFRNQKMIYTVHNYNVNYHIPKGSFFKAIYNKSKVTAVSKAIKTHLENTCKITNVSYIPNTVNIDFIKEQASATCIDENYIVAIGRLNNSVKQFDKLITQYAKSSLPKNNIKLYILGEGKDKENLKKQIKRLKLEACVTLFGFKKNPYTYIKQAKFMVLCSRIEGLPMVILEALALETPVVAFNCKSGPSEMILHNKNGLLIKDQDWSAMLEAIEKLSNNYNLIHALKQDSLKYILPYTPTEHYNRWLELLT